jgi:hypothetical protein
VDESLNGYSAKAADRAKALEDVKKSRQRKGREDRKEESFEKMLCALCDLCVQRDSFTSSLAERKGV